MISITVSALDACGSTCNRLMSMVCIYNRSDEVRFAPTRSSMEYWRGTLEQYAFSGSADRSTSVCDVLVEKGFALVSQLDYAEHPSDWIGRMCAICVHRLFVNNTQHVAVGIEKLKEPEIRFLDCLRTGKRQQPPRHAA